MATLDHAQTMTTAMRAHGLTRCAVADAHHLPVLSCSFDGVWADRTVQHLADPHAAIREPRTLVVRNPAAVDNVLGLRSWAATAARHGALDPAEAHAFEEQFDEAVRARRFTYAVTFFLTAAAVNAR